ncbi:MAG: hypothetical protein ACI83P_001734, partial [Janthinobacterium sp.]
KNKWNALAAIVDELRDLINRSLYLQDRKEVFENLKQARAKTHEYLKTNLGATNDRGQRNNFMEVTGLNINLEQGASELPSFEVHSVLPTLRVTPDGQILKQLIITVTQRLIKPLEPACPDQEKFDFRGGSTLIFDMNGDAPILMYAIKRPIGDEQRLEAIRAHRRARTEHGFGLRETYFDASRESLRAEPFCFLHSEN